MEDHPQPDSELRTRLRELRRSIVPAEQARRAEAAAAIAIGLAQWAGATQIAVYNAFDGELDPEPIAQLARREGKSTFVPVLGEDRLRFVEVDGETAFSANRYGIAEPISTPGAGEPPTIAAGELDIIFVATVAIDGHGNRIGMGAGWYDRTLADLRGTPLAERPALVALVHDEQLVDECQPQPWDVPMDAMLTPTVLRPLPRS